MDEGPLRKQLEHALAGDRAALRALVTELTVVVRCRVARSLLRQRRAAHGRDLRQETSELTQEVVAALFADEQKALRSWDPARGLGLASFVGLLTERELASIFRSRRRNPWTQEPLAPDDLEAVAPRSNDVERNAINRDLVEKLLARLERELSPLGMQIFLAIWRDHKDVSELTKELGMSSEAIWAWRSRIRKRAHSIAADLTRAGGVDAAAREATK